MATSLGSPWSPQYPVKFEPAPNGDRTNQAIGKLIQEFERVYGLLNALDAAKLESTDLNGALGAHIQNTNPHPNLALATLQGNLPANRVVGALTNAKIPSTNVTGNFDTDRINGLLNFVQTNGGGIIGQDLKTNGYLKFSGGFIIQWGVSADHPAGLDETPKLCTFPVAFPTACLGVVAATGLICEVDDPMPGAGDSHVNILSPTITRSGFYIAFDNSSSTNPDGLSRPMRAHYVAFGY